MPSRRSREMRIPVSVVAKFRWRSKVHPAEISVLAERSCVSTGNSAREVPGMRRRTLRRRPVLGSEARVSTYPTQVVEKVREELRAPSTSM